MTDNRNDKLDGPELAPREGGGGKLPNNPNATRISVEFPEAAVANLTADARNAAGCPEMIVQVEDVENLLAWIKRFAPTALQGVDIEVETSGELFIGGGEANPQLDQCVLIRLNGRVFVPEETYIEPAGGEEPTTVRYLRHLATLRPRDANGLRVAASDIEAGFHLIAELNPPNEEAEISAAITDAIENGVVAGPRPATCLEQVEAWHRESMQSPSEHWGDLLSWDSARVIARRLDAANPYPAIAIDNAELDRVAKLRELAQFPEVIEALAQALARLRCKEWKDLLQGDRNRFRRQAGELF